MKDAVTVLFVCMGNICRSPTAHGVFRALVEKEGLAEVIKIDSAGTHAYHVGSPPDKRAQATALQRGVDLSDLVARRVEEQDFASFDYVVAMDQDNYMALSAICPDEHVDKIQMFMDFAPQMRTREVPDPYYGGASGFERVFDLVDAAALGLLDEIRRSHLS
ncbi:low molecular weight protein-tyrosine-phosphatase [Thiosocius teredinicola]|uniref:low molecular weight protein-tyrosine-phosphatase n=1 Tax=Thiosocius teredinicola TaxID=1973002 RepID=UPI000990F9FB